jgi:hypothetical protein
MNSDISEAPRRTADRECSNISPNDKIICIYTIGEFLSRHRIDGPEVLPVARVTRLPSGLPGLMEVDMRSSYEPVSDRAR